MITLKRLSLFAFGSVLFNLLIASSYVYSLDATNTATPSESLKLLNPQSTTGPSGEIISWDIDKDGNADALTDGLLLLRFTFGLQGQSLTDNAIASGSSLTPTQVEAELNATLAIADIDGNGEVDALTDGLLLLRYLFGLTGESLVS